MIGKQKVPVLFPQAQKCTLVKTFSTVTKVLWATSWQFTVIQDGVLRVGIHYVSHTDLLFTQAAYTSSTASMLFHWSVSHRSQCRAQGIHCTVLSVMPVRQPKTLDQKLNIPLKFLSHLRSCTLTIRQAMSPTTIKRNIVQICVVLESGNIS